MLTLAVEQVARLAHLARLDLSADELEDHRRHLADIIQYVQQLEQVETTDVEPLAHPLPVTDVLRDDQPRTGLDNQAALANAPASHEGFFKVPTVLDQAGGA